MAELENSKLTNVTTGLARVTVIVADLGANGKTFAGYEIHSSIIGAPDSGINYPINTILIAASNPTPGGYFVDNILCKDSLKDIISYQKKLVDLWRKVKKKQLKR